MRGARALADSWSRAAAQATRIHPPIVVWKARHDRIPFRPRRHAVGCRSRYRPHPSAAAAVRSLAAEISTTPASPAPAVTPPVAARAVDEHQFAPVRIDPFPAMAFPFFRALSLRGPVSAVQRLFEKTEVALGRLQDAVFTAFDLVFEV